MSKKDPQWKRAMHRAVEIIREEWEEARLQAKACRSLEERVLKAACMASLEKAEERIRKEGGLPKTGGRR